MSVSQPPRARSPLKPSSTATESGRADGSFGSQPHGDRAFERHPRPDPRRYEDHATPCIRSSNRGTVVWQHTDTSSTGWRRAAETRWTTFIEFGSIFECVHGGRRVLHVECGPPCSWAQPQSSQVVDTRFSAVSKRPGVQRSTRTRDAVLPGSLRSTTGSSDHRCSISVI